MRERDAVTMRNFGTRDRDRERERERDKSKKMSRRTVTTKREKRGFRRSQAKSLTMRLCTWEIRGFKVVLGGGEGKVSTKKEGKRFKPSGSLVLKPFL